MLGGIQGKGAAATLEQDIDAWGACMSGHQNECMTWAVTLLLMDRPAFATAVNIAKVQIPVRPSWGFVIILILRKYICILYLKPSIQQVCRNLSCRSPAHDTALALLQCPK